MKAGSKLLLTTAVVISGLLLSGCVQPTSDGPHISSVERFNLNATSERSLKEAVSNSLKDPDSARFGNYTAFHTIADGQQVDVVCGYVNGRNSFGGYTGMTPYIALGLDGIFVSVTISEYAMRVCQQQYGVSI
ncbi:MAG: hypothetical protein HWD91_08740 [Marivivens sp.]|uniref:hypothetical protein n=1 Tax=Marivivens sp. TaxID=1978374 RepID=UPI001801D070|nr:hypothetical protein [Marivivens sp.]NVJ95660.1 hypothetical protein [Marivivens sp.]